MRKISSMFIAGTVAALLAGCGSGGVSPSAAAGAGGTVTAAPTTTAPLTATTAATSPSLPAPSPGAVTTAAPKPSASSSHHPGTPSSTQPATPHISSSHSPTRPPGTAPTSFGYSPTADAKAQIDAARAAAKSDGREVLLDFGAAWCGNCVAMDGAFRTPQVQAVLASSYHLVQIDADTNLGSIAPYDGSGSFGLPVLIVLSPSGAIRVDTNKSGNPHFDQGSFLAFLKKWAV